jgi:hypothetical protein
MPQILEIGKSVPAAEISDWNDVSRLDVRLLARTAEDHRQEPLGNADRHAFLRGPRNRTTGVRTSSSLHDGSFFDDLAKPYIFLPVAVVLLAMWLTGADMFLLPYLVRRRKERTTSA